MLKKDGDRTIINTSISKEGKKQLTEIAKREYRSLARQLDAIVDDYARRNGYKKDSS